MANGELAELEQWLWGAANLLRGPIDNSDFKAYIFPLLFFKRISDVYDEEYEKAIKNAGEDFPENHRFQIPKKAHWKDIREKTENVGQAIQYAFREIKQALRKVLLKFKLHKEEDLFDKAYQYIREHY